MSKGFRTGEPWGHQNVPREGENMRKHSVDFRNCSPDPAFQIWSEFRTK